MPGCSWTAIQALAARWLPPLICDQLTLPKAAPLDSRNARRFASHPADTAAPPSLSSRPPPAYQHQTPSPLAASGDWASRGVLWLQHSHTLIVPATYQPGTVLHRAQPDAARFTTGSACGRSGQVHPACPVLHTPMLALGRLLPCLRGLCPLALPGSPDYPSPFPPPRARGGRGSAPPYPAPLGGFVGGRAGPPIFYGHPAGACLGSVVPGVPPSTALTPQHA